MQRGRRAAIVRAAAAAGLVATVLFGLSVPSGRDPVGWERTFMAWVHVARGSRGAAYAAQVIDFGSEVAVGAVAIGLTVGLLASRRRRAAATTFAAVLLGSAGAELTKHLVDRRIGASAALAYPSGHTAGAAAAATTLALVLLPVVPSRLLRAVAVASAIGLAGFVGLAMVARAYHYPADVIGGLAFGGLMPLLVLGGPVREAEPLALEDEPPVVERPPVTAAERFGVRDAPVPDEIAATEIRTPS